MVPRKLTLQNFLSYGEAPPVMDFSQFKVACMTGANGSGKSALLDAITWALWGEARKNSAEKKPDEGLLRTGSTVMMVEYEFDLNGETFRVTRKYQKGKKSGSSSLLFQIYDPDQEKFQNISAGPLQGTQEKINQILRMNYETFAHAAFILQGRANEFSRMRPSERKEVLGQILGLSHYDSLARLAGQTRNLLEADIASLNGKEEVVSRELFKEEEAKREMEKLEKALSALNEALNQQMLQKKSLESSFHDLTAKEISLREKEKQQSLLQNEIARLKREILTLQEQHREFQEILQRREEITEGYENFQKLQDEKRTMDEKGHRHRELELEMASIGEKLFKERLHLESESIALQERKRHLQEEEEKNRLLVSRKASILQKKGELEKARTELDDLERRQRELAALQERKFILEKAMTEAQHQLELEIVKERRALLGLEEKIARKGEVRERYVKARELLDAILVLERELEEVKGKGEVLKEKLGGIQEKLREMKETIEEAGRKESFLAQSHVPHCPLCSSPLSEERRIRLLESFHRELEKKEAARNSLLEQNREVTGEIHLLRHRYSDLQGKLKESPAIRMEAGRLEGILNEIEESYAPLSEMRERVLPIEEKLKRQDFAHQEREELALLLQETEKLNYLTEEHEAAGKRVRELSSVEIAASNLKVAEESLTRISQEIPRLDEKLERVQKELESGSYALKLTEQKEELQRALTALGYSPELHREIQMRADSLSHLPLEQERLLQAERRIPEVEKVAEEKEKAIREREKILKELGEETASLREELKGKESVSRELAALEEKMKERELERDGILSLMGTASGALQRMEEMKSERKKIEKEITEKGELQVIYQHLERAFGKDGIQALLVEQALPELEETANEILGTLTQNRIQVAFEPLKDLKKGGVKETLEIRISDEIGQRDYELYSGGEAFRTDFALRIALSKLLARRAGSSLKLLVIDEGFGSQDDEGLERLVEAIRGIQDEFEKILVVTHLTSMKDLFPVRIEVTKEAAGSTFQVLHL